MLSQDPPKVWRLDRFNAKKSDVLAGMPKHFGTNQASHADLTAMLETVTAKKRKAKQLLVTIINQMWVELGNCVGLTIKGSQSRPRPLVTIKDLQQALQTVTPPEKLYMMLHFLFNFVRDTIYPGVLMLTHQQAVEQAVLRIFNVKFESTTPTNRPPKSCVAMLYGEVFNDKKQRLLKGVMEKGFSVVVEHKTIHKPKHWKRNKHTFFLYRAAYAGYAPVTTEVRHSVCTLMLLGLSLTCACFAV